ncbi:MAG: DNA internalization-related competence protein ComEC/Rec2 [Proteobacteria bacterium]|nr:DNA internalization-related competence protein ComEC/Rec2 [Pseudomonadota bacterium]
MKNLINTLNLPRDLGRCFSLNIFSLLLIFYISGIIYWYQTENLYLLISGIFILPLFLFFKRPFLIFLICLFFFSLGALRTSYNNFSENKEIKGYGKIITFPKKTEYYKEVQISIKSASRSIYSYNTIRFDKEAQIKPLDFIYFSGIEKKRLFYRNDNDYPKFYSNYLFNRSFIKSRFVKKVSESKLLETLLALRERIKEKFSVLDMEGRPFFIEVLFGERTLQDSTRDTFNKSGTAHLLSISGLHFSLTIFFSYIFVYFLTFLFPNILLIIPRQVLTIIFALPLLVFYALLSGLSIPSTRAFLIFLSLFLFLLLKKNTRYPSLLSLIALTFLIFDPNLIFSISFQLSFASVFALVIFGEKISSPLNNKIKNRFLKYILGTFLATITVNIFILPVITNFQGKLFISAFISNVFAIPIFSFFILPFLFLSMALIFNDTLFTYLLMIPDNAYKILVFLLNKINVINAYINLDFYFNFKTAFIYYLFLFLLLFLPRYYKILSLVAFLLFFIPDKDTHPKNFSAVFLDVGQGESAIIKSDNNNLIMIDCGGNIYDENIFKRAYAPFFRKHKVKEIYAIIISHHHPDHTKALKDILENVKIKEIYLTKEARSNLKELPENIIIKEVATPEKFTVDNLNIELIPPITYDKKPNNNSLWTIIKTKDKKFIFTGDTEKRFIEKMIKKISVEKDEVIYLKVPHHGAKSSFYPDMYKSLKPRSVIISAGADNIWDLPSKEVINFLRVNKINILRTDAQGQITIN